MTNLNCASLLISMTIDLTTEGETIVIEHRLGTRDGSTNSLYQKDD